MHRSGASLVAGLLATAWDAAPLDAGPDNKAGHWESRRLVAFNERLLRATGTAWDDAAPLPDLETTLNADVLASCHDRAGELLLEALDGRPRLVFKDPRLCRLLPFWLGVARDRGLDTRIVHPLRHPIEVALSLGARDGLSPGYAQLLWLRNMLDAERASRGYERAFASYDAVLADGSRVEHDLRRALGVTAKPSHAPADDDLVRPELRHHRAEIEGNFDLIPEVGEAHRIFDAAARSGVAPDASALARLMLWLDREALSWSNVGPEMVARRLLLETLAETSDAPIERPGNRADVQDVPGETASSGTRLPAPTTHGDTLAARPSDAKLREALAELDRIRTSKSWTMTRPLREGGRTLRRTVLHPLVRAVDWVYVRTRLALIEGRGRGRHGVNWIKAHARHKITGPAKRGSDRVQRAAWSRIVEPSQRNADLARYMDVLWYRGRTPGIPFKIHPVDYYTETGHLNGDWPTHWFDPEAYRRMAAGHGVILDAKADSFAHFIREGAVRGIVAGAEGKEDAAISVAADILLSSRLPQGWRIEGALDVRIEDGAFYATGDDPQILINPGRTLPIGVHKVELRYAKADRVIPTLYFDVGRGFNPDHATVMLPEGRGRNTCLVDLPARARRLRLDPFEESDRRFAIAAIHTEHVPLADLLSDRVRRRVGDVKEVPVPVSLRDRLLGRPRPFSPTQPMAEDPDLLYQRWIGLFDDDEEHAERLRSTVGAWEDRPRVSVLMPVYNPPEALLDAAIRSVVDQVYPDWELCVADDASTDPHVAPLLDEWAARDDRIRVVHRPENGHISRASNSALELATGEWLALLDHDDVLRPHALAEAMLAVRDRPDAALIYSDEDKIDDEGKRFSPFFKPDFSPDLLRAQNYLNHLTVHRTERVRAVGGWRPGYEGSQDYDLNLRVTAHLSPEQVVHVPKILYHWRATAGSTAAENDAKGYAYQAGLRALRDAVADTPGQTAEEMADVPFYRVVHALPEPAPKVTLIVPTKDRRDLLELCVSSILDKTDYPDFEIIIVDNNSSEPDTLTYLDAVDRLDNVRVLRHPHPFNYSEINNVAAAEATGDILGLVNNDIEVIHPDWMREMAAQASRSEIGCVGAKLYYPNNTIQHGGVVMGVGGVAGHASINLPRSSPGYFGRLKVVHDVSAVTAACLFVRREVYEEVGGLDAERLKVAFNDVDFCLKVRSAGYRNIWTPFAKLYHHESASRGSDFTEEKRARFQSEIDTMVERWPDELKADPFYNPNLRGDVADYTPRRL